MICTTVAQMLCFIELLLLKNRIDEFCICPASGKKKYFQEEILMWERFEKNTEGGRQKTKRQLQNCKRRLQSTAERGPARDQAKRRPDRRERATLQRARFNVQRQRQQQWQRQRQPAKGKAKGKRLNKQLASNFLHLDLKMTKANRRRVQNQD